MLNGERNRINVYFNVNDECNLKPCNSQPKTMKHTQICELYELVSKTIV